LRSGFPCWKGEAEVGVVAGRSPHGLGMFFGHFDGGHDGTVAIAETQLPGLADHVVVDASHSGLLLSPRRRTRRWRSCARGASPTSRICAPQ
jgi:hypothetical protein